MPRQNTRVKNTNVHAHAHSHRNSNKALFMKGNVCMGMVLKCSGSRMAHLILPERKESESNEKRGVAAVRVAERGGAAAARAREKRRRLVIAECKSNRMMEGGGMEEHKHYSWGN